MARLAVAADLDVVITNSRGPQSLSAPIADLGRRATVGTVKRAARASEATLRSIPLSACDNLTAELLSGRVVLDTDNY